MGRSRMD